MGREEFKKIETNSNLTPCPLCGSAVELWERDQGGHFQKAVMCSRAGDDDEDDCMLYLPPEPFYSATKREAIEYWEGRRWAPQLAAHAEVVEAAREVINTSMVVGDTSVVNTKELMSLAAALAKLEEAGK